MSRLALASLNKHAEAVDFYKKALELDPENESYKSNMKIAELKMKETPSPVRIRNCCGKLFRRIQSFLAFYFAFVMQTGGMGGVDLAGLLSNPGFMNMVSI